MKLGSSGVDVMNLQKVLNMYPQTQVASSGAGSPGMETTYFGGLTRTAVNKFHALHLVELGISAPTGNVFAGTRGLLNQVCTGAGTGTGLPAGCTSTSGYSPVTGQSCGTSVPGGTTSGPISAMLSASQPTGMIVDGQAGARLADITFTGNGTVTSVQLQRTGVSTDQTLVNVYLYDGNTRITDAASVVTGGFINFNAPAGLFTVSGARTITVRADILSGSQGQSVGVKLNSVTAGGSVSTFSNVMGNSLQIANVTTASVNFATLTNSAASVDAGTTNYTVWSGSATVSTRDVNFRAATFKFVGSAPTDAVANLSLYVDGTRVAGPSSVNAANNNKLTFDLGATPYLLKTGSHTIEVRGDIVKGSARNFYFTVENVADLMLEDSNLTGVNVSATVNSAALTQSSAKYNTISVNTGSVTVNVDPAFNANKVTGGATNVPVGQFVLKAYGEDVKVNTLKVTFATTTISTLNNVSLYVNGGQVGTSQNFTVAAAAAGGLTYNLGSSLIIPANSTVTLTVKADIVDTNNAAYTSGTIAAKIGGVASNAQGQSSNEIMSVASSAVTGNVLTIGSGSGTFSRTAGFSAVSVSPNTSNVKIGSFTLQANSSEDVRVNSIGVNPTVATYAQTNVSNLRLMSNGVTLGTPVGNPSAGTTTFSFSDIVVPANGTRTFDVYADIGSATSGSVTTAMDITYRGVVSNTTTVSSASGVAISSAVSSLTTSTLSAQSPVAQFVVGGSTFGIATYTLKTTDSGTVANVRELRFNVSTGGSDAIESVTVGGVTAPVVNGTSTVTGLNIAVSSTGTDVPVTVKFAGYQNSTSGGSNATTVGNVALTLSYVEATSGSGTVITNGTLVASNTMIDVASKPTVTMGAGNVDTLVLGAENKVAEFTVTADANGKIAVATTSIDLSAVGITGVQFASPRVADGNTTITTGTVTGSSTMVITFTPAYEISAGQSKTFSVFAVVTGTAQSGITPYVASRLTSGATFKWLDVVGGGTVETGAAIFNFPTSSFTTKR
jgi:trimeric autotransporter adhesin